MISADGRFLEIHPENASAFRIAVSEIELSFARSSGPGGQNVNKVNSKAVLRWNLLSSPSLSEDLRTRLKARLQSRLSGDGDIVLASDRFRDQPRNREDCLTKLAEILAQAASIVKRRKTSKPSYSSIQRARESKKRHSAKKRLRSE
jgi:ribosome-associated protein